MCVNRFDKGAIEAYAPEHTHCSCDLPSVLRPGSLGLATLELFRLTVIY